MKKLNSAQERYEWLLDVCEENRGTYAIVKYDNKEEALWFANYSRAVGKLWFLESPNFLIDYGSVANFDSDFIYDMGLIEHNSKLYEIDSPQVSPFLPEEIEIKKITEIECLKWLLSKK